MIDTKKKKKKGLIKEEDVSVILQRYTATTIIALIQEVAQFADVKIDWNSLVKKTSTGISNAREYQMLWRYLAYSHTLLDKSEDGAEPLDDDSDLEYDLEAFPPVSSETAIEAAACAKVLTASGLPSDSGVPNQSTIEAPLTINIPNGANITVPVSVQKQPLATVTTAEGLDVNGSANVSMPARRKRKLWTAEEDMELIAAVQKCGEGNWANILKGDFKGDRTASQLSQRWAIIRKRQANSNLGVVSNSGSQLSEAQLAARRAVSLALNMPMMDGLSTACSVAAMNSNPPSSSSLPPASAEASPASNTPMEATTKSAIGSNSSQAQQSQQPPHQIAGSLQTGASNSTPRSRVSLKKTSTPPVKPALGPNPMVQAAAVAAGARIATPSTAASLLKAAQSKNAVHIRPGGNSLIKTSVASGTKPLTTSHAGPRPNVHYIRTATAPSQPANHNGVSPAVPPLGSSQQTNGNSVRPATPTGQLPPASAAPSSNLAAHQTTTTSAVGVTSSVTVECKSDDAARNMGAGALSEEDVKPGGETVFDSSNVPTECLQNDEAALPNSEAVCENQTVVVENLRNSQNLDADADDQIVNTKTNEGQNAGERMTSSPVTQRSESRCIVNATGEDEIMIEEQMDVSSVVASASDAEHIVIGAKVEGDDVTMEKPSDNLGENDDGLQAN
ncbi:uncharacterized protein LOC122661935 isoform X2 [Telopea speciosissima]|uniref:uncharacterized protein LOC122661935 isoform X2 n=1 Tax=Telopea speciosissima TaxID=54955 RepID=UPI001CC34E7D|nr:uncharacterized protein LOC122661935 isoform X2 [Telopea speciosissima]